MMSRAVAHHDDLNLFGFLDELWRARAFLFCGLIFGLVIAFVVMFFAVPHYRAHIMVGPAQSFEMTIQHGATFSDQTVNSAARSSASSGGQAYFTRFSALYNGVSVAELLLRDPKVVDGLKADHSFVFEGAQGAWTREAFSQYLQQRVWLDPFGETELRSMNYRHPDAQFAAYLLQQIHRTADQLIRADIRAGVDERISYLEREIGKTLNPDHRRAITALLLEQERTRMIVSMDEPVAAKVIEKASVSAKPVWPNAALFYSGFGFVGLFVGYVVFGVFGVRASKGVGEATKSRDDRRYESWFKADHENMNFPADKRVPPLSDTGDAAE